MIKYTKNVKIFSFLTKVSQCGNHLYPGWNKDKSKYFVRNLQEIVPWYKIKSKYPLSIIALCYISTWDWLWNNEGMKLKSIKTKKNKMKYSFKTKRIKMTYSFQAKRIKVTYSFQTKRIKMTYSFQTKRIKMTYCFQSKRIKMNKSSIYRLFLILVSN